MDDPEIQETVESILGKGIKVVDCEKKSSIKEEEVFFINGIPVTLEGRDGLAIKQALITGQVPPCDLLNALLIKTGILKAPVKLDTSLSVTSTTVTKEEVTVSRAGKIVDERSRETKEQNFFSSAITEVYEPIKIIPTAELLNGTAAYTNGKGTTNNHNSDSSQFGGSYSSASSFESDVGMNKQKPTTTTTMSPSRDSGRTSMSNSSVSTKVPSSIDSLSSLDEPDYTVNGSARPTTDRVTDRLRKCHLNSNGNSNGYYHRVQQHQQQAPVGSGNLTPTIFGTVASDHTPKDCTNRRSLPQTPQTKGFCSYNNGDNSTSEHITDYSAHQENALVYKDGNLVSGPLEALIQHMVPTDSYYPDRAYLFAFLLSSRLFIKPHDLLSRICAVCDAQQGLGKPTQPGSHATHAQFANHLVQLLAEWTETFPYDFRDERVMEHVRTITEQCYNISPHLRSSVSALLQNLLQRLTALEQYEAALQQHASATTSAQQAHQQNQLQYQPQYQHHGLSSNGSGVGVDTVDGVLTLSPTTIIADISELCPNAGTLAQQLTHVELERLSFIGPEEFVQAFAKENPHLETSFKDMKKTHNLEQYVQWFNRLSYLVATQVCRYPKKKQRVRVVEFWVEVGRECFNIGNFNSLMAIIAGLNMSPISRLKKTWSKIQSGKFAILEHQMDPSSNFSSYRSTLKAAMWRSAGATDQRQRIVIPFFSLLVKDLYFLNQGCSNKLPNGHINFDKFWQLAKQVTEFIAWKQVTCPFEKDAKIIALLQQGPVLTENALALASFDCEPPENNQEKERCKTLKSDVNNAAA